MRKRGIGSFLAAGFLLSLCVSALVLVQNGLGFSKNLERSFHPADSSLPSSEFSNPAFSPARSNSSSQASSNRPAASGKAAGTPGTASSAASLRMFSAAGTPDQTVQPVRPAVVTGKPVPVSQVSAASAAMPSAPSRQVFSEDGASIDYSNASQGYIMVKYSGSAAVKVLIYFNGASSYYQYDVGGNNSYVTLPLQSGSGSYRIRFMKRVTGSLYAELCSKVIGAAVGGTGCFLYPNQYVSYTAASAAVSKARSLCANSANNSQKVAQINKYITSTIKYDYAKAKTVQSGYLPNVDGTLSSKKGICFDYSALMAAMCRSQGIPTKLVVGHTSAGYHAWNEVYLGGWKRYDTTFAAAGQTAGIYTAEKYY